MAHCIALPIIAVSLPFGAAVAEAEWVHWFLSTLAIGASATVIITAQSARSPQFLVPALLGMTFVCVALFAEGFGVDETTPTVIGGVLLAAAHTYRLIKNK